MAARSPEDLEAMVISISADITKYQNQIAKMADVAAKAAASIEKSFTSANDNVARSYTGVGRAAQQANDQITRSARATRAETANMAAQFQDIAVSLQGGMAPISVALQQGTQLAAVLQQAGQTGGGALKALGAAALSLINPVQLLTIGFVAAAGFAFQYFMTVIKGSNDSAEALAKHQEALNKLADNYRQAAPEFAAMIDKINLGKAVEDATKTVDQEFATIRSSIQETAEAINRSIGQIGGGEGVIRAEDLDRAIKLQTTITSIIEDAKHGLIPETSINAAIELMRQLAEKGIIDPTAAQAAINAFAKINTQIGDANKKVEALNQLLDAVHKFPDAAKLKEYQKGMEEVETIGKRHVTDLEKMDAWLGSMLGKAQSFGQAAEVWTKAFQQTPAGGLGEDEISRAMQSSTAEFIKARESFTDVAKRDLGGAFRVGFWSDTVTDEFNRVTKVVEGMTTTIDAANRDLARRIIEAQNQIANAIGANNFAALTENQKTALTSIVYNYGKLPDRIVAAFKAGGGTDKIAQSIFDLGTDNAGINRKRRALEAALFGGSAGRDFEGVLEQNVQETQSIQEKIAVLQAELEARNALNAVRDEETFLVTRATEEAKLEQDIKNGTLQLTDEEIAKRKELIATYANYVAVKKGADAAVKQANKDTKQEVKDLAALRDAYASMATGFLTGFVNDLKAGASASEALQNALSRLADQLLQMAAQKLFQNVFGSVLGVPVAHSGGPINSIGMRRNVSPLAFAGAPRFARGGMVGVGTNEVPAILHRGEVVIPASMVRQAARMPTGSGGGTTVRVGDIAITTNLQGLAPDVKAESSRGREFGLRVQALVQSEIQRQSRPGGILTAQGSGNRVGR